MIREHRHELKPGSDLIPIRLRHHPTDLGGVAKIVDDPRRQKRPQRHGSQAGMFTAKIETSRREMPRLKRFQIGPSPPRIHASGKSPSR